MNVELEEETKRRKRASFLGWLEEGGLPGLTGPVEADRQVSSEFGDNPEARAMPSTSR